MKKLTIFLTLIISLVSYDTPAFSQTVNEADTELCETIKYALINSLREPIDKAISEIYKDDEGAPESLMWASYDTEILKIKQLYGVGGAYEITLKVKPYYRAHITYGEDIIVVSADGKLIDYEHLKTYLRMDFN
ncbi:DUF3888 domain-containing protein [Gracilibacillus caseinilyticus]|uniref:DUF3888 domain-containing protein n=1 Tax=Gracilibacillus caseinilyticus TaxID=2932256 RepID=A0ABY4F2T9_9BACI|nr:DUF3888 domain-containing protein [Gracilibacillus caseinilyticus]UOQ50388.1 DUF3888 domain-containing protein [Gracilibacillus caseinilyticus]